MRYLYLIGGMLLITFPTYVIKIFTVLFLWNSDLSSRLLLAIYVILLGGLFFYGWYLIFNKIKESKKIEEDFILIPMERKLKLGYRRLIGVWQNILFFTAVIFLLVYVAFAYLDECYQIGSDQSSLYILDAVWDSYGGRYSAREMLVQNTGFFLLFTIVPYSLIIATFIFRKIRSFVDWLIEGFKSKD